MTSILIAAAAGLIVTLTMTPFAIRLFRAWGFGQRIREAWYGEGPEAHHGHLGKVGTPTMGGIVILFGMGVAYLVARLTGAAFTATGFAVLVATFGLGLVGFLDDYLKIRKQRSLGLNKTTKIVGQALVALAFGIIAVKLGSVSTHLSFIRLTALELGLGFYVWVFLVMSASSNAVNLTDGLDGLASGSSALVLAAYVFIAFWQDRHACQPVAAPACYPITGKASLDTAIVAASALGAVAGFLWWNAAPARIFMGDTGSLAIGGLLAALAVVTETQLLLVILGGLYVLETTSVIIQIVSFRMFHRRVFRMAPIHHHFELVGWHEFTVIVRFWIVAGLSVAFGLGLFYADFLARGDAVSGRFAGERAVVVGLGTSGVAAARVLAAEGATVRVTERGERAAVPAAAELEREGIEVSTGGHRPEHLDRATLVVASPGVPEREPVLVWAADRGLPVWSEIELGARLARVPYVAITGTNGKSTTTEMVAAAMRAAGLHAVACGNIGHPFSLAAREEHDALAVEVSSFQLRHHASFHPRVSVLLNLAPDHLDWHGTFGAYADAKARVFELQTAAGDVHVGNADDAAAAEVSKRAPCAVRWFRLGEPGPDEVGYRKGSIVAPLVGGDVVALGTPRGANAGFRADAAGASAAALAFGLDPRAVADGIGSVEPLPHRGQVVAEAGGVRFVDDSKATNPHAALAALDGMHDVVLIAGGQAKGVDLRPLAAAIPALAGVVAIGEAAGEVEAVFEDRRPVRRAPGIEDAVRFAFEMAPAGGTVLLAPACASMDMFRDYTERGDRFTAAAREVAARPHGGAPNTNGPSGAGNHREGAARGRP